MPTKIPFKFSSKTTITTQNMNMSFFSLQTLPFLLFLLLPTFHPLVFASPSFTKIYAFGDSYTDTGNTVSESGPTGFSFASKPPYGMTFFHHPANRYSDGRLVIDFLAQRLSLPLIPPYRGANSAPAGGSINFAVAGCTAIEHEFFVKNNLTFDITPESIGTQLGWFNKVLGKGCNQVNCGGLFDDALVWVGEIGANDYAYAAETSLSKTAIQNLAITRISNFLQAILSKGAKYVVVQGLPPTGCLTLAMLLSPSDDRDELGCVRSQNKLSFDHNTLLQAKIQDLRKQFPQSLILYADYYNAYSQIMKNLPKYGLKEPFQVCCGVGGGPYNYDFLSSCGSPSASSCSNPSQYINWDGVHLTDAMNKAVSGLLIQGEYCQPSFQSLLNSKRSHG